MPPNDSRSKPSLYRSGYDFSAADAEEKRKKGEKEREKREEREWSREAKKGGADRRL